MCVFECSVMQCIATCVHYHSEHTRRSLGSDQAFLALLVHLMQPLNDLLLGLDHRSLVLLFLQLRIFEREMIKSVDLFFNNKTIIIIIIPNKPSAPLSSWPCMRARPRGRSASCVAAAARDDRCQQAWAARGACASRLGRMARHKKKKRRLVGKE